MIKLNKYISHAFERPSTDIAITSKVNS